ncbi:uncharacterized protein EI97DRAFT_237965 [Westerdykella ornata]|uniref:CoA-dependent acyltransferase n=1 Tax=Westerdykella ornata TaxID=318751 RepID=A0A6A6J9P4_WESOR|nr:uncharacterized protein EI97DRAFT_237965 [Westerdykella ornata]KAF2271959.1 hypothetical protein EI97DRAFT_237965 [Westerdykella ornata]
MSQESQQWLSKYSNNYHAWKSTLFNGRTVYQRALGLVETSFDTDGSHYGGRADMNALFTVEIRHSLSPDEFRERITLVWANLRLHHVLLQSRVDEIHGERNFTIEVPNSYEEAIQETQKCIVWIEDLYPQVDENELYKHCFNVSRIIDPSRCLSRLYVLPPIQLPNGNFSLRFLVIMAHQISDGLSSHNWFSHFLRLLNAPFSRIRSEISEALNPKAIASRLPLAQEDLYPKIPGSKARQRWFWALLRVLRHVRNTLPPTFTNPLRRGANNFDSNQPPPLPPKFSKIFVYSPSALPPLRSGHLTVALSPTASKHLISLCRSAKVSIGAGCFALAGLSMMELEEARNPHIPPSQRPAFAASFPLNPRPFFGYTGLADSCMLAFSDGVVMPFLPKELPIDGRFRLVAKHANRELKVYQKRLKDSKGGRLSLEPHSPLRMLANGYLGLLERVEAKLPPERKTGANPQGNLPAKTFQYGATCGVSSVGSTAGVFRAGMYDLDAVGQDGKDFAADYRGLRIGVRARDNEFLIGSSSDYRGIVGFGVSYDASAISEEAAEAWAQKIQSLLEKEDRPML